MADVSEAAHPTAPTASATYDASPKGGRFRRWVIRHEESKLFLLLYVTLAVVLSLLISLFWLFVVVAAHFAMEVVSHSSRGLARGRVVTGALWEVKLDVVLVLFALALSLYLEFVFGVVGLGTAARMATAGARFAAWQRVIRGVFLTADDALMVGRGVVGRVRGSKGDADAAAAPEGSAAEVAQDPAEDASPWRGPWGKADWATIVFGGLCVLLILAAPWITAHTWLSVYQTLGEELHPWP